MHPIRPLHGINGRMRQHIHSLGRHYAIGFLPQRAKNATRDEFLNELVESGEISIEELRKSLNEVQTNYDNYAFLSEFSDRVLDKADDVFWMKYGRTPEEHEWAVEYKKICHNLKSDPHCYDYILTAPQQGIMPHADLKNVTGTKFKKMKVSDRLTCFIVGIGVLAFARYLWLHVRPDKKFSTGSLLFLAFLCIGGLIGVFMAIIGRERS